MIQTLSITVPLSRCPAVIIVIKTITTSHVPSQLPQICRLPHEIEYFYVLMRDLLIINRHFVYNNCN